MSAPNHDDAELDALLDLQRAVARLVNIANEKRKKTARRRGRAKSVVDILALPGPQPTELDTARAKRLVRTR